MANMAKSYIHEIPEGYEARIEGNKVIIELAESEDERIRKEIIKTISWIVPDCQYAIVLPREQKDKWLSWLEMQKEWKPIKWTDLTWKDIVQLEGIINNVHYEFRNGIGQESFGKEVLEKFREYKGDEYLDEKEHNSANFS